jgi:membrane associated rhomboid family serine protease
MGIYDREYYRRDGPSFLGSFSERGKVCKGLVLANIVCFIVQMATRQGHGWDSAFTEALWLDAGKVLHGEVWRLLSYAFLHSPDWQHIVFNMLFLWWFGSDVEDLYGPREFLALYLVSAVLGGVVYVLAVVAQLSPPVPCLGASGAVTAVLVLCALHYPDRVILLMFILPVPIWLFVLYQVAKDSITFLSGIQNGTAVTVHLAGAGFAFLYQKRQWRLLKLWAFLRSWPRNRSRPRLRVYKEEETPVPVTAAPAGPEIDEQLEAKVDAVLEKVARSGQASLTESERQILLRASEVYKRRRS